jgi:hypothetical protein
MSGSNWMDNCDDDFSDSDGYPTARSVRRKRAKEVIRVYENSTYGVYCYDYSDYQEAKAEIDR